MRKLARWLLAALALGTVAVTTTGCYDWDDGYYARPTSCYSVWVPAHYDRWGRYVVGHWRCY